MDQFTDSLKAVIKQKIVEKSVNECIGCVLGEVDDSQHFCRASMVENTERFFNRVFTAYVIRNRSGIMERLRVALCEDMLAEGHDRETARAIAAEQCTERSSTSLQVPEVSSTTPLPAPSTH